MSESKATKEAEFLDGLTQAICTARAEYTDLYQKAWLTDQTTMGPDEYLALCAVAYMRKHAPPQMMGGQVKLPHHPDAIPTKVMDEKVKTFWLANSKIFTEYGVVLPGNRQMIDRLRATTYNFIGSLHED